MDKITLKEIQRSLKRNGYTDTFDWVKTDTSVSFPKTLEFFNVNEEKDTAEARTSSGGTNVEDYGDGMLYISTELSNLKKRAERKFPDCLTGIKNVWKSKDGKKRFQFQHCFWDYDKRKANEVRRAEETKKLPERK